MNRQRRAARDPSSAQKIRDIQHRVEQTGQPGRIYGLTDACRDCTATGDTAFTFGGCDATMP